MSKPKTKNTAGREFAGITVITTKTLETLLEGYRRDAEQYRLQAEDAQTRLRHVLASEEYGQRNLELLFGELVDEGVDEQCTRRRYRAVSGYALVDVMPSGQVIVSDPEPNPHKRVPGITITRDATGEFSSEDLKAADTFLALVTFSRNVGRGPVTKLSMTARPRSASDRSPVQLHPGRTETA